jgi:hypothetical protein
MDRFTTIPVTITAADIRSITWIIGQFVRIAAERPEVLKEMTASDPSFAAGMCYLANQFAKNKCVPVPSDDETSAVSLDDIMEPLVDWSNSLQRVAMHASDLKPLTEEQVQERMAEIAKVRVVDDDEFKSMMS